MSVKIHIEAGSAQFKIEGEKEFALRTYDDVAGLIEERLFKQSPNRALAAALKEADAGANNATVADDAAARTTGKATSKRNAPGCREHVMDLKANGFFSTPRSNSEVRDGLRAVGHSYQSAQIGAALTKLHSKGELGRTGSEGKWLYVNP